jgi:hypothetical protein
VKQEPLQCHHAPEALHACLTAAGIADDCKAGYFVTARTQRQHSLLTEVSSGLLIPDLRALDRAFVSTAQTPRLVLAGNDEAHLYPISGELWKQLTNCEFIAQWKMGAALDAAKVRVKQFLMKHTPPRA